MSTVAAIRTRAEHTPAGRERYVDLLRLVAIAAVVVGHWLMSAINYHGGELSGRNALDLLSWSHPITWLFQVMPIFFLVGGFANAASLTSTRRSGGDDIGWMMRRAGRLLRPTTAFLITVPLGAIGAVILGADKSLVGRAAWIVSIPLWFLIAYLAIIAFTPFMHALHRRAGLAVPAALVGLVALCDVLRLGLHVPYVGSGTYLFAWLAIHQLGFSWQDGRLPTSRRASWIVAAVGLSALLLLTLVGPYAVRMVDANTDPPSIALMALATTQIGIVLALREPANRWLARTRPWTVVVGGNAVIMTVYIWHMTAAVLVAALVYPTGVMAQPKITSAAWLAWRVPWLALCAAALFVFVVAFSRIELRREPVDHSAPGPARSILILAGGAAVITGLFMVTLSGGAFHWPSGIPPAGVLTYLAGIAVFSGVRRGWVKPRAPAAPPARLNCAAAR